MRTAAEAKYKPPGVWRELIGWEPKPIAASPKRPKLWFAHFFGCLVKREGMQRLKNLRGAAGCSGQVEPVACVGFVEQVFGERVVELE